MSEECSHQCGSCGASGCGERTSDGPQMQTDGHRDIKHIIAVVSGKGGVGKSSVTGLLASTLTKKGYKVGILDADITGPSIPRLFGVEGHLKADEKGIIPSVSASGIKMVSANLFLPENDTPVAWRGPVISGVLSQFWSGTSWGELDVLLIDMPPGTSDVFLTVFQQFKPDGIVTVSAPQELVGMIVGKAVNLAKDMDKDVIGLVENMAYFVCDGCEKKHYIFGEPQAAAVAEKYGIPSYASLPIDPRCARLADAGKIEEFDVGDALDPVIDAVLSVVNE